MKSKQVAITTVTRNDSSLTVEWENGESGLFHYMWLRDCCYCETCGDCHSSLRSYVPGLDTLNIRPQTVTWSADELNIVWEGSGHCSSYRSDWLNAHRYDDKARAVRRLEFTCWNAATAITPASFDFASVNTEPEARLILQKRLLTHGFVVVRNGPANVTVRWLSRHSVARLLSLPMEPCSIWLWQIKRAQREQPLEQYHHTLMKHLLTRHRE